MRKRMIICSLMIIAVQLYSMSCYAYTNFTQSANKDAIIIDADGYSAYETVPVIVLKEGKNANDLENATNENIFDVVGYMGSLSADKDGKISGGVELGTDFESKKDYVVVIKGVSYKVTYVKKSDRLDIINDMISEANQNNDPELKNIFSGNKSYLSIDNNILNICSNSGVSDESIVKVLLPEIKGMDTLSDVEKLDKMPKIISKAMLVAALNAGKLKSSNDKEIVDNILVGGQYASLNKALIDSIKLNGLDVFMSNINNKGYESVSAAETGIAKELILDTICYPKSNSTSAIKAVLESHSNILGLDLTDFNGLSAENKAEAVRSFSSEKPTLNTMKKVFKDIVDSLKSSEEEVDKKDLDGSSSGISGSSGGAYMGIQNAIFNDIGNYPWAQEAITSLYSAGVISGYGNGSFAPQNNIKREEFVTIVVSAFYKDAETEACSFSDVSEDAWYYKNIAIAANKGIVSGMSKNSFGVGRNITRQDMAVILYRIAGDKLGKQENYTAFSDDGDIADYAKEAVYALREVGVINGVSTSEFAPKKNATRAETAVMVYRFLSIIGREGV